MAWEIRVLDAAGRDLARLDKLIARCIAQRIRWLSENVEAIQPEGLSGDLAGFHKLRVEDWRVVYEILRDEKVLLIHVIDHRSQVYRRLRRPLAAPNVPCNHRVAVGKPAHSQGSRTT